MFVYDLSQRTLTSIQVGANAGWPIWATDGERVLFSRFDGSTHDMYWARADNASPPVAFGEPDVEQQHPQWFSEDGEWVIVQWRPVVNASNPDLWLVPTSGVDAGRPLVAELRTQLHASLSPDGRWLLYSSTVSEQNEIYVTEFPEPRTRVTVSTERGYSPLWSPRGDEIYYRRWGDHAMMVAPVLRSDSVFRAGTPTMLFAASAYHTGGIFARSFDVSADAQRFLMIRSLPGSEVSEHIVMIQNWVQDLERRLGG